MMTTHPEFPQESPAMKYIVEQVAKIEDAQACGMGYYKSLGKVLSRLDKTDELLNQLKQTTADFRKITDANVIATVLGNKSDDINLSIQNGLTYIGVQNTRTINENLKTMGAEVSKASQEALGLIQYAERVESDLHSQMTETITRLDKHIKDVDERIMPPLWKIYAYTFVALGIGILIGKFV